MNLDTNFRPTDLPEIRGKRKRDMAQALYNFYYLFMVNISPLIGKGDEKSWRKFIGEKAYQEWKAEGDQLKAHEAPLLEQARKEGLTEANIEAIRELAMQRHVDEVNAGIALIAKNDGKQN